MKMMIIMMIFLTLTSCSSTTPKLLNHQEGGWKKVVTAEKTIVDVLPQYSPYSFIFLRIDRDIECLVTPIPLYKTVALTVTRKKHGKTLELYMIVLEDKKISSIEKYFLFVKDKNVFEKECGQVIWSLPDEAWQSFPNNWNIGRMGAQKISPGLTGIFR